MPGLTSSRWRSLSQLQHIGYSSRRISLSLLNSNAAFFLVFSGARGKAHRGMVFLSRDACQTRTPLLASRGALRDLAAEPAATPEIDSSHFFSGGNSTGG